MGEEHAVKGRTAPPLTRRQQKKARRAAVRRAQTGGAAARADKAATTQPALPTPPTTKRRTSALSAAEAGHTPAASAAAKSAPSQTHKPKVESKASVSSEATAGTPAVTTSAAELARAQTMPPQPKRARKRRTAPKAVDASGRAEESQPAVGGGRRYPTLARMVGVGTARMSGSATRSPAPPAPPAVTPAPSAQIDAPQRRTAVPTHRLPRPTTKLGVALDSAQVDEHHLFAEDAGPQAGGSERHQLLPEPDLLGPVAAVHAATAVAAVLVGMALLLQGDSAAYWSFVLAATCGLGGWFTYPLIHGEPTRRQVGGAVLLVSQLGILVWLVALLGPRPAILTFLPAITLFALRTTWRRAVIAGVVVMLWLDILAASLTFQGLLTPGWAADPKQLVLADCILLVLGIGLLVIELLDLARREARSDAMVRARLYEARVMRTRARHLRQQIEDDASLVEQALARALRGRSVEPIRPGSLLGPVAESVELVAERLATLQQDREERVRLEGAVRSLTRAVERAWLGLPWVWPRASGTPLDELTALLQSPRPTEPPQAWPDEAPTLVPIPSITPTLLPMPWDALTPKSAHGPIGSGGMWRVPPQTLERREAQTRAVAGQGTAASLPWREWDPWADWSRRDS